MQTDDRINSLRIVKFAQELLSDEPPESIINPALISQKIDMLLAMHRKWGDGLDRQFVIDELIRRFSITTGKDTVLVNNEGHIDWLNAARKKNWRYWQRYREWLESRLPLRVVDALDKSTDEILEKLEDPSRSGSWSRRGLVVGHVQSGKTGNYTALINKAADADYKIIIVLAGLHNNLRSQTQIRLEEGFLGYQTDAKRNSRQPIGVGNIDRDSTVHPNCATTRDNSGDFGKKVARHLAITPEARPWLFVVKKNKSVLSDLLNWIQHHVADTPISGISPDEESETGKKKLPAVLKRVTKLPLLVIDDEADHASVDTQEQIFDAEGKADEEHSPTAINSLIRRILNSFSRSAYVGYTATPFANIFIHERGETKQEGADLFPAAFIHNLSAPSNYVGPAKIFGLQTLGGRTPGMPLVREIADFTTEDGLHGWMPPKHKNSHIPKGDGIHGLPISLIEAIDSFLLACAVRNLRGQVHEHGSMLIHVTRFNLVQAVVFEQVEEHVRDMRQRITRSVSHEEIIDRMNVLWEVDFLPTTKRLNTHQEFAGVDLPAWSEVVAAIPDVISDIDVRMINGTAKDALDYVENSKKGLRVIAIGGDKLARGLTLEGLSTSYFLRASRMYDTLMQMGRWFGYRPGYLDVSRLYTTTDLIQWFGHIADAAEELREEFDQMSSSGATPRDYGLKVQSHPVLMVTSRLKMRSARNLMLSFSGRVVQTVALSRTDLVVKANYDATIHLLSSIDAPKGNNFPLEGAPHENGSPGNFVWKKVPTEAVCDFLQAFKTHPAAYRVNGDMLVEFIQSMAKKGELTEWTIVLSGPQSSEPYSLTNQLAVGLVKRTGEVSDDKYSIGVLLDPKDELVDLDSLQWSAALTETIKFRAERDARESNSIPQNQQEPSAPSGAMARKIRGKGATGVPAQPQKGILVLYLIDPTNAKLPRDSIPIVGFALSFPESDSSTKVEYKVNNVHWELEYGPAE